MANAQGEEGKSRQERTLREQGTTLEDKTIIIMRTHLTKGRAPQAKRLTMNPFHHSRIFTMAVMIISAPAGRTMAQETAAHDPAAQKTDVEFQENSLPLFDGESLAGWEGNGYWFRVEDGAIVAGRLTETIPHNEFLCTTQNYDDFDLRYEAKLIGEGKNAGVQFRSKRVANSSEVSGYQADIGHAFNRPVWGSLYDESRRRKMLAEPDADVARKAVKEGQWNKIRVLCQGRRIQIFVNGVQTVDYVEMDDEIPGFGVIGLQIHSGKPSEAWYRNLRIRQL
jgi:hypothetical protein